MGSVGVTSQHSGDSVRMSSDRDSDRDGELGREESFRSALRNQRRRLSATEKKSIQLDIGGVRHPGDRLLCLRRDSLTPPRRKTPPRDKTGTDTPPRRAQEPPAMSEGTASKQSTPDIKLEFWDISELSPLSTPATSTTRSPSPFDL